MALAKYFGLDGASWARASLSFQIEIKSQKNNIALTTNPVSLMVCKIKVRLVQSMRHPSSQSCFVNHYVRPTPNPTPTTGRNSSSQPPPLPHKSSTFTGMITSCSTRLSSRELLRPALLLRPSLVRLSVNLQLLQIRIDDFFPAVGALMRNTIVLITSFVHLRSF